MFHARRYSASLCIPNVYLTADHIPPACHVTAVSPSPTISISPIPVSYHSCTVPVSYHPLTRTVCLILSSFACLAFSCIIISYLLYVCIPVSYVLITDKHTVLYSWLSVCIPSAYPPHVHYSRFPYLRFRYVPLSSHIGSFLPVSSCQCLLCVPVFYRPFADRVTHRHSPHARRHIQPRTLLCTFQFLFRISFICRCAASS